MEQLYRDRLDSLIRYWATVQGMPWLLIKAQVEAESGYDALAVSECGAMGLLQLMSATAAELGCTHTFDPDSNLRAGISYLRDQYKHFPEIPDTNERYKFALASYNAGRGNINKAVATAKSDVLNWDTTKWSSASAVLCRITGLDNSKQTTDYVEKIMANWQKLESET